MSRPGYRPGEYVSPISTLQRLARKAAEASATEQEQCELCGERIPHDHRHLLEVVPREARCVCYPCSVLFDREAASLGKFKLIPDRRLYLPDFLLADAEWDRLRVPVGLAFCFHSTPARQAVAFYPAPMGATQALLETEVWQAVERRNPVLRGLQPDVEALLVNRTRANRDHYVVPIDECFRLVAVIRTTWRGLTGGQAVWQGVDAFFQSLQSRSKTLKGDTACQSSAICG